MSLVVSKPCRKDEKYKQNQTEDWKLPLAFNKLRHTVIIEGINWQAQTWRMKERVRDARVIIMIIKCNSIDSYHVIVVFLQMKTVSVALVLCLNVGVDPPDIVKTQPCARLECWIGEFSLFTYSCHCHYYVILF